jgi:RNA polymerase sigma-70 factor (ECF subfamily)
VPLEHAFGVRADSPTPEARAIAQSETRRVRAALSRLSHRDREAILLVAVGELTMRDAAAALGLSVSAVKMRLSRSRARLTALLEDGHA